MLSPASGDVASNRHWLLTCFNPSNPEPGALSINWLPDLAIIGLRNYLVSYWLLERCHAPYIRYSIGAREAKTVSHPGGLRPKWGAST